MKVILTALNARYTHSSLALRYLEKYCAKFNLEIAEFSINDKTYSVYSELLQKNADVYCFSCYIWNITQTKIIASMVKTALPKCIIVFGGPEAEENYDFVDYTILGEGEQAMCDLLTAVENGESVSNTVKCDHLLDLSTIPQPYTKEDIQKLKGKIIYFETSRGCPFCCSYCLSSIERKVRYFPMEYVKKGLKLLFEEEVPLVKFVDRTFNSDKERASQIIKFIIENSTCTCVHLEIAPHLINDEIIGLLSSAPHLFQLEMGIQSSNKQTLKSINRDFDINTIAQNVLKVKKTGVHIHLDLIAGLPYEDYSSFKKSFDFVYSLQPDMLQLGFLKVLHNTPIEKFGGIYFCNTPPFEVIYTNWITPFELSGLKDIEDAVDRFYNSGAFVRTINKLTQTNPFAVFEKLADMLKNAEAKGSLPRHMLYYILYDFGGNNVIKELSFDFLQNNKDRPLPSFVKRTEPEGYKEFCHAYLKEHNLHLKNVRFEPILDSIIFIDYEKNTISDLSDLTEEI